MKYIQSDKNKKRKKVYHKLYKVEKIITRKIVDGRRLYLIKWEGYSIKYCSWEPLCHLINILDMVENFENNYPKSIDLNKLYLFNREYEYYNSRKEKKQRKKRLNKDTQLVISKNDKIIINIEQNTEDIPNIEDKSIKTAKYNALKEETNEANRLDNSGEKECVNISRNLNNENNFYYKELIEPKMIW